MTTETCISFLMKGVLICKPYTDIVYDTPLYVSKHKLPRKGIICIYIV